MSALRAAPATAPPQVPRLLGGPAPGAGPESLAGHVARFGPRPSVVDRAAAAALVTGLERTGLRGRGGAAFPTAVKWRAVASRSRGDAVVVANGAEGEPASLKDRALLAMRPHLVLDGLVLAAEAVRASTAVVHLSRGFDEPRAAIEAAIAERRATGAREPRIRVVAGPHRYVAGEETAVVACIDGRPAKPSFIPPRPYQRGVGGRPTLVQNVETLAHAAQIARFGDTWFREAGTPAWPGTALLTLAGAVARPGVHEVALGTTVGQAITDAGGLRAHGLAVLVGGYFGRWVAAEDAWGLPIGPDLPLGAGVVAVVPQGACGVAETARILDFLARQSAHQCGPCTHGVTALAETFTAVASGRGRPRDPETLARWSTEVAGRGACRHPDGAAMLLESALRVFAAEVQQHLRRGACAACAHPPVLPTPRMDEGWR